MAAVDGYSERHVCGHHVWSSRQDRVLYGGQCGEHSAVASADRSHGMEEVEEEETAVCRGDVAWS